MATGDLKNNLRILNSELKRLNVPVNMCNLSVLAAGNTDAFIGIFDYLLQWYSPVLSRLINTKGLKAPNKENKAKFLEGVYLIFREIFNWRPPLTAAQFTSSGFHERKVIMCTEFVRLVNQKIQELDPKRASKKEKTVDNRHSGLKLNLKPRKNLVMEPLKEKDPNVKNPFDACGSTCGVLKGESCFCSSGSEKPHGYAAAENHMDEENSGNQYPTNVSPMNERILAELLEFKGMVLNKFESIESRLSVAEKRIIVIEDTLCALKSLSPGNSSPASASESVML